VILALMRLQGNPVSFNVAPDARVLLFTTAAALFSGLLFGLAPRSAAAASTWHPR